MQVMMNPVPVHKPNNKSLNNTQELKLTNKFDRDAFFSSRNGQPLGISTTIAAKKNS